MNDGLFRDTDAHRNAGDRDSDFMDLLAPWQARLLGYIFALVSNIDDAHDIYQQTVMALWRKFDEFQTGSNFMAWALKVAQFEILHYRRTRGRSRVLFSDEVVERLLETQLVSSDKPGPDMKLEFLQGCLEKLSSVDRALIEKCYLGNMRVQQVALALGRSSQSICNSLRRIRMSLLECIDFKRAESGQK
jgi:RNA polymerase sigma-70 factor (ECF subfamily)